MEVIYLSRPYSTLPPRKQYNPFMKTLTRALLATILSAGFALCQNYVPNPHVSFSLAVTSNGPMTWDSAGYLWYASANAVRAVNPVTGNGVCGFTTGASGTTVIGLTIIGTNLYASSSNGFLYHTNAATQISTGCSANVGSWNIGGPATLLTPVVAFGQLWTIQGGLAKVYNYTNGNFMFTFAPNPVQPGINPVTDLIATPNENHGMFIIYNVAPAMGDPGPENAIYHWNGDGTLQDAYTDFQGHPQFYNGHGSWNPQRYAAFIPAYLAGFFYEDSVFLNFHNVNVFEWYNNDSLNGADSCSWSDYDAATNVYVEVCDDHNQHLGTPLAEFISAGKLGTQGYIIPAVAVLGTVVEFGGGYAWVMQPGTAGSGGTLTAITY